MFAQLAFLFVAAFVGLRFIRHALRPVSAFDLQRQAVLSLMAGSAVSGLSDAQRVIVQNSLFLISAPVGKWTALVRSLGYGPRLTKGVSHV